LCCESRRCRKIGWFYETTQQWGFIIGGFCETGEAVTGVVRE
jgi:hypothetical protein